MAEDPGLTAAEYLDRFFDEMRAEVRQNPAFASRLVKALGGQVVFDSEVRTEVANPYVLAATGTRQRFFTVFGTMKSNQIKQVLKDNNLATRVDMNGKTSEQLVDMLYERAASKVTERKSSMF